MDENTLFISGWAGPGFLFPGLTRDCAFAAPFLTHSAQGIEDLLGENFSRVIAWSTGAHIVLKHPELWPGKKILLLAPFLHLPRSVPDWALRDMQKGMRENPKQIINSFWAKCGIKNTWVENMDFEKLAKGLEFLRESKAELPQKPPVGMTLVRASRDRIVSFKKEKKYWPKAWLDGLHTADSGHFFPEQEILGWTGEQ
ncbi:MAG: hypothetical protein ACLFSY_05445 [Desulfonatronovibrionaceae bacterium]